MEVLNSNSETIQKNIEIALEKYHCEPVGSGYIDIITDPDVVESLINELTTIGIAINGVTWWCFCSKENQEQNGCPHGMGGPRSVYKEGWYSEMGIDYESFDIPQIVYDSFELGDASFEEVKALNESITKYIREFSQNARFIKCLTPALWLHLPNGWKRVNYMKY